MKLKALDLFCGTHSVGREFENFGFEVVSLDYDEQFEATITADILTLPDDHFNGQGFNAFWASFPCNAFSVAVIGRNWNHDHTPKTPAARLGLAILEKTNAILRSLLAENPDLLFWMENPRGKARRMPALAEYTRHTVTYCQYEKHKPADERRMKPTDIWTNTDWRPRPVCSPGADCHEKAPRGSRTGTQGIKGARDRSVIPSELCLEIAEHAFLRLCGGDVLII